MPFRRRRLLPLLALAAVAASLAAPAPAGNGGTARQPQKPEPERLATRPPPSLGERAAAIALGVVGTPYRWGGESPASGFDCSGLVRWAYGRVGVDLPHNSYALYGEGRRVARDGMRPGDLLFFEGLGHVGLYLGRGRMVHAPYSGRTVEVVRLTSTNYGRRLIGARRVTSL
jgi:cell wall-associated NlpC family hydrolase